MEPLPLLLHNWMDRTKYSHPPIIFFFLLFIFFHSPPWCLEGRSDGAPLTPPFPNRGFNLRGLCLIPPTFITCSFLTATEMF